MLYHYALTMLVEVSLVYGVVSDHMVRRGNQLTQVISQRQCDISSRGIDVFVARQSYSCILLDMSYNYKKRSFSSETGLVLELCRGTLLNTRSCRTGEKFLKSCWTNIVGTTALSGAAPLSKERQTTRSAGTMSAPFAEASIKIPDLARLSPSVELWEFPQRSGSRWLNASDERDLAT